MDNNEVPVFSQEFVDSIKNVNLLYRFQVNGIVNALKTLIKNANKDRRNINKIKSKSAEMYHLIENYTTYINFLQLIVDVMSITPNASNDKPKEHFAAVNDRFSKAFVKPHPILDNMSGMEPVCVEICSKSILTSSWSDVLVQTCEYLYNMDSELFNATVNDCINHATPCLYNADMSPEIPCVRIPNTVYFVRTDVKFPIIRKVVFKLLDAFSISLFRYKIYLKHEQDETVRIPDFFHTLNKMDNVQSDKTLSVTDISTVKSTTSIAKPDVPTVKSVAKAYFSKYLTEVMPESVIEDFLNAEWCYNNLGINYPLLKKVDPQIPIKIQKDCDGRIDVYYSTVYQINGDKYLLCRVWTKNNGAKLFNWIERSQDEVALSKYKHYQFLIKFDKTYGGISIMGSVLIHVFKTINDIWETHKIITSKLISQLLSKFIMRNTSYANSGPVLYNIKKYLLDNGVISRSSENKNHFYMLNQNKLQKLILAPTIIMTGQWEDTSKTLNKKTELFVVNDKQDQVCPCCYRKLFECTIKFYIGKPSQDSMYKVQGKRCAFCGKLFINTKTYRSLLGKYENIKKDSNLVFSFKYAR